MDLIRGVDASRTRQAIVGQMTKLAHALDIAVIAEGVETREELSTLRTLGVRLMQGYLIAKPAFERLPQVDGTTLDRRKRKVA